MSICDMRASEFGQSQFSVGFVLLRNFTLFPYAAIADALRLAADQGDLSRQINCKWTILGNTSEQIRASCGIEITPWEDFGDPERFDYVIVVGGLLHREVPACDETLDFLVRAAEKGVSVVGVCTGVFTLARAGLLKGRRCCVSWFHYQNLMDEYGEIELVADQIFVTDGNIITCAGGAGAVDLAAWIIERHLGKATAQKSLHIMLTDRARPGNTPQPQPPLALNVQDFRVKRAALLIEQNLTEPLSVEEVASSVHISKRQLERLFRKELGMGIQEFSRRLRLHYGLWLLLNSERRVTEIAYQCGFSDTSHFSRLFRSTYEVSPAAARREKPTVLLKMLTDVWRSTDKPSEAGTGRWSVYGEQRVSV